MRRFDIFLPQLRFLCFHGALEQLNALQMESICWYFIANSHKVLDEILYCNFSVEIVFAIRKIILPQNVKTLLCNFLIAQ